MRHQSSNQQAIEYWLKTYFGNYWHTSCLQFIQEFTPFVTGLLQRCYYVNMPLARHLLNKPQEFKMLNIDVSNVDTLSKKKQTNHLNFNALNLQDLYAISPESLHSDNLYNTIDLLSLIHVLDYQHPQNQDNSNKNWQQTLNHACNILNNQGLLHITYFNSDSFWYFYQQTIKYLPFANHKIVFPFHLQKIHQQHLQSYLQERNFYLVAAQYDGYNLPSIQGEAFKSMGQRWLPSYGGMVHLLFKKQSFLLNSAGYDETLEDSVKLNPNMAYEKSP